MTKQKKQHKLQIDTISYMSLFILQIKLLNYCFKMHSISIKTHLCIFYYGKNDLKSPCIIVAPKGPFKYSHSVY